MSRPEPSDSLNDPFASARFVPPSARLPQFHELGGLAAERYPALHEWQIRRHAEWRLRHAERVESHRERVKRHLRAHARSKRSSHIQGISRATWCVELELAFHSISAAARFVGRAPSNIRHAIRSGRTCGSYHWKSLEPNASHAHGADTACNPQRSCASEL